MLYGKSKSEDLIITWREKINKLSRKLVSRKGVGLTERRGEPAGQVAAFSKEQRLGRVPCGQDRARRTRGPGGPQQAPPRAPLAAPRLASSGFGDASEEMLPAWRWVSTGFVPPHLPPQLEGPGAVGRRPGLGGAACGLRARGGGARRGPACGEPPQTPVRTRVGGVQLSPTRGADWSPLPAGSPGRWDGAGAGAKRGIGRQV